MTDVPQFYILFNKNEKDINLKIVMIVFLRK